MECFTVLNDDRIFSNISVIGNGIGVRGKLAILPYNDTFPNPVLHPAIQDHYVPRYDTAPVTVITDAQIFQYVDAKGRKHTPIIRDGEPSSEALVLWIMETDRLTVSSGYVPYGTTVYEEKYTPNPGFVEFLVSIKPGSYVTINFLQGSVTVTWNGRDLNLTKKT